MKVQKVKSPTLSKELQATLEKSDTRQAIRVCGAPCQSDPAKNIATPTSTADYTCNGGNCACAGAADCVLMAPICQEDTIGCNDYGCTCKEGSGD